MLYKIRNHHQNQAPSSWHFLLIKLVVATARSKGGVCSPQNLPNRTRTRSNILWPQKLAATEAFWLRWCVIFGQIFGLQSIQSAPYIAAVVATAICGKSCDMGAGAMSDDMSAVQLLRAVGKLWKKLDLCVVCEHGAYGCLKRRKTTVCVCWTNAWFWEAEWAMSGWIPSKDVGLHAVWDCNHFVVVMINAFLEICSTICEPWQRQTWILWRWGNSFYEAVSIIMEPWGG